MHACCFRSSCEFHNDLKKKNPMTLEAVNKTFCEADFTNCARFLLYRMSAPYTISKHLFPEDLDEAAVIMKNIAGA